MDEVARHLLRAIELLEVDEREDLERDVRRLRAQRKVETLMAKNGRDGYQRRVSRVTCRP